MKRRRVKGLSLGRDALYAACAAHASEALDEWADFARQLERELSAACETLGAMTERSLQGYVQHPAQSQADRIAALERELAAEARHAADCSRAAEGYCNDLSDCIREKVDIEQRITSLEQCLRAVREAIEPYAHRDNPGAMQAVQLIDRELPR